MTKKQIALRGFYGNGNLGDEALLHSIMNHFSHQFDFKLLLNSPEKVIGKSIAPYNRLKVINSLNRGEVVKPDVCGFFLGGGGLGLGFGYNQMICARRAGKAIIHSGVHIHEDFFNKNDDVMIEASRGMLKLAHITTVRDRLSVEVMEKYDVPGEWLPDWAFALRSEEWDAPLPEKNYVVVTFRARPPNDEELIKPWLDNLQDFIKLLDCELVILPFDAGDAKLASKLGFADKMIPDLYFRPEQAKYVISKAKAVFSFGRFHPIVFALSEHVPAFAIDYWYARESGHKTTLLLREDNMEEGIFHTGSYGDFNPKELERRYLRLDDKMKGRPFSDYPQKILEVSHRMVELLSAHSGKRT